MHHLDINYLRSELNARVDMVGSLGCLCASVGLARGVAARFIAGHDIRLSSFVALDAGTVALVNATPRMPAPERLVNELLPPIATLRADLAACLAAHPRPRGEIAAAAGVSRNVPVRFIAGGDINLGTLCAIDRAIADITPVARPWGARLRKVAP